MKKHVLWLLLAVPITLVSCNGVKHPHEEPPPIKEAKISKINFFMETSGSMAGYLKGGTDFKKVIPNILVNIESKSDSGLTIHNYYISDSIIPFQGSTDQFITEI